jgi:integrase
LKRLLSLPTGEQYPAAGAARPPPARPDCDRPLAGFCTAAGIGDGWTPRELRTSFVSLLSHRGVSIEEIARLVGHASTRTTEMVYRRELRPVITTGAEIMDQLFTGT